MVSGGGRLRPQEDSLNTPIDMVVGTPGRVLQHIEEGNLVYGDIKYVVIIIYISLRVGVFLLSLVTLNFVYSLSKFPPCMLAKLGIT